ncbi:hypothetical protein DN435_00815 [Lactobacillus reuteri]|uniref:DUF6020 family protein n=1 Tax=Limosilactobacillus reuteri TaxID=1598 RepID=UPI00128C22A3|nr:DUF6020 family protein [Limosilactobacillus reuteri]MQB78017.1 hypothetical protein [Limosilactobacillus reuteri]
MISLGKENKYSLFAVILSLISVIGLNITIKTNDETIFGNSLYSLLAFIPIFLVINKAFKISRRKRYFLPLTLGIIFSSCLVFGRNTLLFDDTQIFVLNTWIKILMITPLWTSIIILLFATKIKVNYYNPYILKLKKYFSTKKGFFTSWGLIIICWLPYLVIFFPGIYGYDGPTQVQQFLTHKITTHHPFLHTTFLGLTVGKLGGGSKWWLGLFIYSCIQLLIFSFSLSYLVNYISKHTKSFFLPIITLLTFLFVPFYPIMAITTTKNVIFSALFIILEIQLLNFYNKISRKQALLFLIFSFLAMAFLKQSLYVYIISVIVIILLLRNNRKKLITLATISVVIFAVFNGPILSMLNVVKSNTDMFKEALSLPECQISRAVVRHPKVYSAEIDKVKKYLPDYQKYEPLESISDPVKTTFNSKLVKDKPTEFLKLYWEVGKKEPQEYVNAFCKLSVRLWDPDMNVDTYLYEPYWETESLAKLPKQKEIQFGSKMKKHIQTFSNNRDYEKIPVLSLLYSAGLPFFIMLIGIASAWQDRDRKNLMLYVMPFIFWIFLLIFSPVILLRYVLPLISMEGLLLMPILNKMFFISYNKKYS